MDLKPIPELIGIVAAMRAQPVALFFCGFFTWMDFTERVVLAFWAALNGRIFGIDAFMEQAVEACAG